MWVCNVCGLELDDSLESCPFGCGPKGAVVESEKQNDVNVQNAVKEATKNEATHPIPRYMPEPVTVGGSPESAKSFVKNQTKQQDGVADIADIDTNSILVLTEGKTGGRIEIDSLACVLGRNGDCGSELFFSEQVSRVHMEISHADGAWKGCHVGLNPSILVTTSGRINMEHGIEYPLHDGDRLRIANQTFLVGIEAKKSALEKSNGNIVEDEFLNQETTSSNLEVAVVGNDDMTECWCVVCPKCGAKHQVRGADDRVTECQKCTDPMDRREIRRITPVFDAFRQEELIDAR